MYQTKETKMAKTRTITATFPNGETRTRTTARNYVGVVQGFNGRYFHTHWCGREDLFQKAIKTMVGEYRVAKITDPWAE